MHGPRARLGRRARLLDTGEIGARATGSAVGRRARLLRHGRKDRAHGPRARLLGRRARLLRHGRTDRAHGPRARLWLVQPWRNSALEDSPNRNQNSALDKTTEISI